MLLNFMWVCILLDSFTDFARLVTELYYSITKNNNIINNPCVQFNNNTDYSIHDMVIIIIGTASRSSLTLKSNCICPGYNVTFAECTVKGRFGELTVCKRKCI